MNMIDRYSRWLSLLSGEVTVPIATTPRTEVFRRDGLAVYRYHGEQPPRHETPILLVYSLINKPSILDLQPSKSVVRHLLARGYDVYLLDWGTPDSLDQCNGMDVYLNLLLRTVVRQVCKHSGRDRVSLLGYCMGGTMAAIFAALHPERVANLLLLGAGFDFRSQELLYQWSSNPRYKPEQLPETCGNVPAWAFEGFNLLRFDQKVARTLDLFWQVEEAKIIQSHLAMDQWVSDNIPMAGQIYAEFNRQCFVENRLIRGQMHVGGKRVDLGRIECPTLILCGAGDHLVPPEVSLPLKDIVPHCDSIVFPTGHVGLSVSSAAHRKLWPQVCDWLAERSNPSCCNADATAHA